jgi:hypothetical protein
MHVVPFVFWGSAVLSIGLSIAGVVRRSGFLLVGAAILAVPMAFYLGASPRFRTWGFLLPCLQILAAVVVKRSAVLAAALLVPFVSLIVWLAIAVLTQDFVAA